MRISWLLELLLWILDFGWQKNDVLRIPTHTPPRGCSATIERSVIYIRLGMGDRNSIL